MKSFRFLLLLPILFIFSCNNTYYSEDVVLNTETKYYPVDTRSWKKIDVPPTQSDPYEDSKWSYFYCEFTEPLLTSKFFENGVMNAYMTDGGNKSIITPLPFDNFYSDRGFMWTEQVTCEFTPKKVTFIIKYNDFRMDIWPGTYTFMVRYAW